MLKTKMWGRKANVCKRSFPSLAFSMVGMLFGKGNGLGKSFHWHFLKSSAESPPTSETAWAAAKPGNSTQAEQSLLPDSSYLQLGLPRCPTQKQEDRPEKPNLSRFCWVQAGGKMSDSDTRRVPLADSRLCWQKCSGEKPVCGSVLMHKHPIRCFLQLSCRTALMSHCCT